jgi:ARC6-like, IMS domain
MEDGKTEKQLWKTYKILMAIMIGGAVAILSIQAILNYFRIEQAKKEAAEVETYSQYEKILRKIASRSDFSIPTTNRSDDVKKAEQYCKDVNSGKSDPKKDWGDSSDKNAKFTFQQAQLLSQIQTYCPQNLGKLPQDSQEKFAALDNLTQEEAMSLVKKWQDAKPQIFAPPFDRNLAESMATGAFLEGIVQSGGSIDWLQRNNAYYAYGSPTVGASGYFKSAKDQAEIDVNVRQEYALYASGKVERKSDASRYRYKLVLENNIWKIAFREEMQ